MAMRIYNTSRWNTVRDEVIARDGSCVLSWLGECSGPLHVHHTSYDDPYNPETLVTLCERHHRPADQLRRLSEKRPRWKRCPHRHLTRESREQCERRLNSRLQTV